MDIQNKEIIVNENGDYVWRIKEWLPKNEAQTLCDSLKNKLPWEVIDLIIFGMPVKEPRRTFVCGDEGLVHKYTGVQRTLNPWVDEIKDVKEKLNKEFIFNINSCLANEYEKGSNYIGWHSDKELKAPDFLVCTVSLGGPRDFYLRHKTEKLENGKPRQIELVVNSGDLLVMSGSTQQHWLHTVPKRSKTPYRISLTFRRI